VKQGVVAPAKAPDDVSSGWTLDMLVLKRSICHDSGHDSKDVMIRVRMWKGTQGEIGDLKKFKHWFVTKHSLVTVFCQITGGGVETAIGTWPSRRLNLGVKGTFIWIIWIAWIVSTWVLGCFAIHPHPFPQVLWTAPKPYISWISASRMMHQSTLGATGSVSTQVQGM
jgi:hypothetical protein